MIIPIIARLWVSPNMDILWKRIIRNKFHYLKTVRIPCVKVVPELIPSTIQERYPGQVLHFVWTNLEDDRQEIMKEEKVYKFLVCKKGLIQTDKIDCIYKKIKYR